MDDAHHHRRPIAMFREKNTAPQHWLIHVAMIIGAACVMALIHMTQVSLAAQAQGRAVDAHRQLLSEGSFWGAWVVVAILTDALSRRARLEERAMRAWLVVAGMLALALVVQPVLDTLVSIGIGVVSLDTAVDGLRRRWLFNSVNNFQIGVGLYAALVASRFYSRYREKERAERALQGQLASARLEVLRSQLDPHFLFNSMNAIAMLARRGASADVVRMVTGLSDFLRESLDEGRPQLVSLARELEFVARYLGIEQVRFQDRLRVSIDAPPDVLNVMIPTFILQPLVENAVRHGVSEEGEARVEVTARNVGDALEISIRDHGAGVMLSARTNDGVGLRNSRARLLELYGPVASLTLSTHPSGGAVAVLRIPLSVPPRARELYVAAS